MIGQACRYNVRERVSDFISMMSKYPDHPKFLVVYYQFMKEMISSEAETEIVLPVMEMMTLLEHERPLIHSLMKKTPDHTISMLVHLVTDVDKAKSRLYRMTEDKVPC